MKKNLLTLSFIITFMFTGICTVFAAEVVEAVYISEEDDDNDELFEAYMEESIFYPLSEEEPSWSNPRLEGNDALIYGKLRQYISEVAEGIRTSTVFEITPQDLGIEQMEWTAEDLGISAIVENGEVTQETYDSLGELSAFNFKLIQQALRSDCPYELYWYEKTASTPYTPQLFPSDIEYVNGEWIISIADSTLRFSYPVDQEYSAGEYTTDPTKVQTAQHAAAKAQSIVDAYESYGDYDKLLAYKNEICGLVSYNTPAAADDYDGPIGPWQLVYVFDEDPDTKVVCEGYSKAFKYLFDLSDFRHDIVCSLVSGRMAGGTGEGAHMWNIVRMENGLNYYVDVTNCDEGTVGADDLLFLAGTAGSVSDGYTFTFTRGATSTVSYYYTNETRNYYTDEQLTISDTDYTPSDKCGESVYWELDEDGVLYIYGVGDMTDLASAGTAPWSQQSAQIREVVIDEGVTSIGDYAFTNCHNLDYVQTPSTLEKIGLCAFMDSSITGFTIPRSVTSLGRLMIRETPNLTDFYYEGTPSEFEILRNGVNIGHENMTPETVNVRTTGILVDPVDIAIQIGEEYAFTAGLTPSDADSPVVWKSDHPEIVSVDENGKVSGISTGTAVITAMSREGHKRSSSQVTVTVPASVTVDPIPKELIYNGAAQELVTAGEAENGTMLYALGETSTEAPQNGYTDVVPDAAGAGTYYVWYKADGSEGYGDSTPACVTASISPLPVSVTAKPQTVAAGADILKDASQAELAGAVDGHKIGSVTLTGTDTSIPTLPSDEKGTITVSDAVIIDAEGNDVTENYSISYEPGELTVCLAMPTDVSLDTSNGRFIAGGKGVAGADIYYLQLLMQGEWYGTAAIETVTRPEPDTAGNQYTYDLTQWVTDYGAGEYTFTVWANYGDYPESVRSEQVSSDPFIHYVDLSDPVNKTVIEGVEDKDYTGSPVTQQPVVKIWRSGGYYKTLTEGSDYILSYENNVKVGRAALTITGKGDYTGTKTQQFRILFKDVPKTHPFFNGVYWAVDNGITYGYTGSKEGLFGVNDGITRGQVAMFLWRVAGKPQPKNKTQTFKDVPTNHRFYTAIQWGYENHIIGGYSGDRKGYFGPDDNCTRGQIIAFMYRYAGNPAPAGHTQTFSDVPTTHKFYKDIQWAAEQGITNGYKDGTFGVNKTCTRGHCVMFLRKLQ